MRDFDDAMIMGAAGHQPSSDVGLRRRVRTPSFSNPFCSDGADCDEPQNEEELSGLLRTGEGISKGGDDAGRTAHPVPMLSRRHVVPLLLLVACTAVVAYYAAALSSALHQQEQQAGGGLPFDKDGFAAFEGGKTRTEYGEVKDPTKYHWSSKLVSLQETLRWYQALPDLPAGATGMHNIGTTDLAITIDPALAPAARARVQRAFNLGARNLHAFSPFEALRHFSRCLQLDPRAAACYWGLHMAMKWDAGYSVAAEEAEAAMRRLAAELGPAIPAPERLLIEVAISADETEACTVVLEKHQAMYKSGQSTKAFVEVDSFCSWQLVASSTNLYGHPLQPERGTAQQALARLAEESPLHTGTHHYVIHAYEDTFQPQLATRSARTLERLAPGAAHFQHMPGHIYYLIGDYAEACRAFQNSTSLDEQYFADTGVLPANNWNYIHNMAYAVASFIEAGRRAEALEAAAVLAALDIPKPDDPRALQLLQPVQFSPDTSRAGGRFFYQALLARPFVLLRNQEWGACAGAFGGVLDKMAKDFNVGYLMHLSAYYRSLQLFCEGMAEVYPFVDMTGTLVVDTAAFVPGLGGAGQAKPQPLVVAASPSSPSARLVAKKQAEQHRQHQQHQQHQQQTDGGNQQAVGGSGGVAVEQQQAPTRTATAGGGGRDVDGAEGRQLGLELEEKEERARDEALARARKMLGQLIEREVQLTSSSELDDNDGLAPPEVHVKNRAFFALGVHVLELQAVVKAAERNFRRSSELLTQADSREQHILYNEPVCYPRPVLQTTAELELLLYFSNAKASSLYLDKAAKSLTAAVENPIHQRSGHVLRQLVLALLLKYDFLQEQQHQLRLQLQQHDDDDDEGGGEQEEQKEQDEEVAEVREARRSTSSGGGGGGGGSNSDGAAAEAAGLLRRQRREHLREQEAAARENMAKLLRAAQEYTSEFEFSWRFADVEFAGWSDRLPQLQASIAARLADLEEAGARRGHGDKRQRGRPSKPEG